MWEEPWHSPELVRIIGSIHLSTTLCKHLFHSSFLSKEHMCPIDWPGESSAPASQRSWVRVPLKTPDIFQVHIRDDHWDCPECVRIIASFISQPHFTNIPFTLFEVIKKKEVPCYLCNHSTIKTSYHDYQYSRPNRKSTLDSIKTHAQRAAKDWQQADNALSALQLIGS